jgi:hypothetical protein
MSFNYKLIGGQAAGGENDVFEQMAREVEIGGIIGRGFVVADPEDVFKRRFGHVRLHLSAADTIASVFHKKDEDQQPARWTYRGTVYRDGVEGIEELDVHLASYSFSDTVHIGLQEAPPKPS